MTLPATSVRTPLVGTGVKRREDRRLLTGKGEFLDDLAFADFLEAAIVRSSVAHARVRSVDVSAAVALPGVAGVFTAADLEELLQDLPPKVTHPDLRPRVRFPIVLDEACYVGEPIAVVVAESRRVAEDAADLVVVDYEPFGAVASTAAALAAGGPVAHLDAEDNVCVRITQRAGEPDAALASAPHVLSETFRISRGGGHSMEGRAVAARYEAATGELTVWDATQAPHYARQQLAVLYGLTEDRIRVIAPTDVGGGFGPKAQFYGEEVLIPYLAMRLERPIKWIEDRWENFVSAAMERTQTHRVEVGFDEEGHLLVLKDVFEHDQGAYCLGLQVPTITMSTLPGPYVIPNIHSELVSCYTNMAPTSSLRGAGRPQAVTVMERMVDRVAEHLGLAPEEVRRRNLIPADAFPYRVGLLFRDGSPLTYDSGNYPGLLDGALARIDLAAFRAEQTEARKAGRFLGVGIAMCVEGTGLGPYEGARVRLTNFGRILVTLAAAPQGQGYQTVYAQLAADALGVDFDLVDVRHGDTANIPFGQGTFGSRVTANAAPAVHDACRQLAADLRKAAAMLLGVDAEEIEIAGDAAVLRSDPEQRATLLELTRHYNVGRHGMAVKPGSPVGLERTAYFTPERAAYSSAINVAVIEVDAETGLVTLLRTILGHDCGTVLNPLLVDGQVYGGFAHGVGNALYEEMHYDEEGTPLTVSYLDYALPGALELVTPELFHQETPSPLNPLGVKGTGESGTIPTPAAIANAVEDALRPFGARITTLPLTPPRVLGALGVTG
ncbi:MAG TPA: xanthine dehydrogenase family protein molybdopterin-binding subunit [Acidimicrobiales bacterium]|nr:xanthine dehydrogenase family protein molybdopterin-binding subunit [Acidimicrobiales bacterium]